MAVSYNTKETQSNLDSTTITEIVRERKHIYPISLCGFVHGTGFLRQNLYPWSVLQCRTTDTLQDQTSQILAKLHRLGSKLFLNSYLHQAPADTIPLESLMGFKVLFP